MNFDEIGTVWRSQTTPAIEPARELDALRGRAARLIRAVHWRDRLETGAALVLLPLFAWALVSAPGTVSAIGAAVLVLACIGIPIRLRMARGRTPDPALPLIDALRAELARVRAQERLLGSVASWYLAPLCIGVILLVGGGTAPAAFRIGYAIVAVAFFGLLLHLNLGAVRRDIRPIAHELETWIAELDDTSAAGDTDDE